MQKKLIAFFVDDPSSIGVTNVKLNLSRFINKFSDKYYSIIFSGEFIDPKIYDLKFLKINYSFFLKRRIYSFIGKIVNFLKIDEFLKNYLLKKYHVDIVSHSDHLPKNNIKNLFWIPDFQFMHYANNFDKRLTRIKKKNYIQLLLNSNAIILSSKTAFKDLKIFLKNHINILKKSYILNFKPDINFRSNVRLEKKIKDKIFIKNFFYVPNHLWIHKNFECIIETVRILKRVNFNAQIIASGSTYDYRNPNYFNNINNIITKEDLNIKFLGNISSNNKYFLFLKSIAVINPSFFEGWSTVVEEAKYFNNYILLSDIPTHREQKPKNTFFFNPNSPDQLAKLMQDIAKKKKISSFNKKKLIKDQKIYLKNYIKILENL